MKYLNVPDEIHVYRICYTNILSTENAESYNSLSLSLRAWTTGSNNEYNRN
jgi:hypothetical protein